MDRVLAKIQREGSEKIWSFRLPALLLPTLGILCKHGTPRNLSFFVTGDDANSFLIGML